MILHYVASTSQPKVAVKQSDDNQPRQDNESDQMEHTKGLYISICVCLHICVLYTEVLMYLLHFGM